MRFEPDPWESGDGLLIEDLGLGARNPGKKSTTSASFTAFARNLPAIQL